MRETIIENPEVSLFFHRAHGIVQHEIHKSIRTDAFRTALSKGADILEANKLTKWMSDDRNHVVLSPEDENWARTVWFPRVKGAGWKHWAIVKPAAAIGALNLNRFLAMYAELGINATLVTDFDEALQWLIAQK
jgi:hypothetical protein